MDDHLLVYGQLTRPAFTRPGTEEPFLSRIVISDLLEVLIVTNDLM